MDDDNQICWSYISKLLDKIDEQAERLHWDELLDKAADVFDAANKETDASRVFFEPYQYLFRLYYRVKKMDAPAPFNEVYNTKRPVNGKDQPFFRIRYYDYSTFLWARKNGFTEYLDNNMIDIPKDKLTEAQRKHFEKQVKN